MKILIIGPQGSGKSTQARLLVKKLSFLYLSTGDIFRQIARKNTLLGRKIKKTIDDGHLVDDKTTLIVVERFLENKKDFVIEGFPRNLFQARKFQESQGFDRVFSLRVSKKEIMRRLTSRRVCENCGANFNLLTKPPKKKGVCDLCGGKLIQRKDDKKEIIERRLAIYRRLTEPVLGFYRKKGLLKEIDGERPIGAVLKDILSYL